MEHLGEKQWPLTMSVTVDLVIAKQGLREAITGAEELGWRTLLLHGPKYAQISLGRTI